jgi:selenide,water dikinase
VRLTGYAHGGGCACKIPPGELETMLAGLAGVPSVPPLVGFDEGDDAAAVRLDGNGTAILSTVDFFTPVVDDACDWGRIDAANAQTSGALLVCGEVPGAPVIGELRPRGDHLIEVR